MFAFAPIYLLALLFALVGVPEAAATSPAPSEAARYRSELRDLHVARHYTPGKTAFVLGLEERSMRPTLLEAGDRRTLLSVEGIGSLRHIWQTHGPGEDPFILEFFVDGETTPSIRGTLGELIIAAQKTQQPYVLNPGGFISNHSRNLYLPVPFEESLQVDIVAKKAALIFLQLDYRVDDASLKGVTLAQSGEGENLTLSYEGLPTTQPSENALGAELQHQRFNLVGDGKVRLEGPGIIRRLAVTATRPGVRMRIRFDGEQTPAVDVDLADFFGPFRGTAFNNNQCYLPMPFGDSAEIEITGAGGSEEFQIEADVEPVEQFADDWRYFHATSASPQETDGALPFQVLYARGSGHWLGMALYGSGMDHGGGDFTVVDGESHQPHFLHGINGEDYFSFAYFGRGENFPYSEAFDNDTGRLRLHLENPYPFEESLQVSFAVLRDLNPRAVSYWYADSPADASLAFEASKGLVWDVFGPVEAPVQEDGHTIKGSDAATLFAPLPSPDRLDAGEPVEGRHLIFHRVFKGTFDGWKSQPAIGPHLNLTYVYGHVTDLGGSHHMGYYPRLMMAQTTLQSPEAREVTLELSYDDPIEVQLNGEPVHFDPEVHNGFVTRQLKVRLSEGGNHVLVRMADTPNVTMMWAGLGFRVLDADGTDITRSLQPR